MSNEILTADDKMLFSRPFATLTQAFDASGFKDEALLALFYWDTEQGMWRACPESGVNVERNCVAAATYHFTRFAIMQK